MSERSRLLAAALAGVALLTGACSGSSAGTGSPLPASETTPTTSGGASEGAPTRHTTVSVDLGRWRDDAVVTTVVRYLQARQSSMRTHRISPEMVRTSSYQWLQQQRREMVEALEQGWTVPARAVMAVHDVRAAASDAVVRICLWGPSVDYLVEATGEPVRARRSRWYPFDVRLVFAGDRWLVAGAAQGEFGCKQEQR